MTGLESFRIDLLLLYLAATGLFSYVTMRLFGRNSVRVFALLFLFNTLMVVVGPLLTLLFYFYLTHNKRKIPVINAHLLDVAQLQRHFPLVKRHYGEGPPERLLNGAESPEGRKVRLLTHLIRKLERQDVRLLQSTLSGKSDEGRLLSFGVLNNMEQRLNDRISDLQERLAQENDAVQRAIYEQEIAYLYREFVYYGLVT
ncbi:MAG TPA: hypothetical protein ENK97_02615, partial [Campylobacteraceae bacterium]|nr:hypothetical protein [Campylobacteraceae bacterium]